MTPIPYGRQSVNEADIDAVVEVLRSNWLTQGPAIPRFEAALASACAVPHVIAVSSATAALHIAALAAGLGPGKLLWTSPNTFVASANCARYCGAEVDFVDIDLADGNMSMTALAAKLESAASAGRLPDVVIPVHFAGQACDMAALDALRRRYGFMVIEDASHAIGGSFEGEPVGSCRWSDMCVFSFHPVKVVTTGEGGAVTTRSPELAGRLERLRCHGITRDVSLMDGEPDGPWAYAQIDLGFNYRLTDIQAALGASQLTRLAEFVSRRHAIAERYDTLLAGLPVRPLARHAGRRSALHLYSLHVDEAVRRELHRRLAEEGVLTQVHYIPVHLQPYYRRLGFRPGDFPAAEAHYRRALSLPMFPAMTMDEQDRVVLALRRALG